MSLANNDQIIQMCILILSQQGYTVYTPHEYPPIPPLRPLTPDPPFRYDWTPSQSNLPASAPPLSQTPRIESAPPLPAITVVHPPTRKRTQRVVQINIPGGKKRPKNEGNVLISKSSLPTIINEVNILKEVQSRWITQFKSLTPEQQREVMGEVAESK